MPSHRVKPIERSFKSVASTTRNDKKLKRAQEAKDRKFKPSQNMDGFEWSKEHTMMLKRLVVLHYTKGKPCTVIYAKFNELASTTLSSQYLLRKIKDITELNGGSLARILSGKAKPPKKVSSLITGQRGAGIKD